MGDHELLIRMDQKLTDLGNRFDAVSNGTGFPRCVERAGRITQVEKELGKMQDSQKWAWRTIVGTGIVLVGKSLWAYLTTGTAP